MDDPNELFYNINLCSICQFSENLNFASMMAENISEYGTTYMDLLNYVFPEVQWPYGDSIIPLICRVCLETLKEVAEFKTICLDTNRRRTFQMHPAVSVREQIKIEIVPDPIENALMHMHFNQQNANINQPILSTLNQGMLVQNATVNASNEIVYDYETEFNELYEDYEEEELEEQEDFTNEDKVDVNHIEQVDDPKFEYNEVNMEQMVENKNESQDDPLVSAEADRVEEIINPANIVEKRKQHLYLPKYFARKEERECRLCYTRFNTYEELKDHVLYKHGVLRNIRCDICQIGFNSAADRNRHMYKHNGARPFSCSLCSRTYITKGDLVEHRKYHMNEAKIKCETCGAMFNSATNLRTHMSSVHSDPKDYKHLCVVCGNKYSTSGALADHIQFQHNTRSINCTMCNKKFYAQKDLTRHMIRHTNDYKFYCQVDGCEARFKRKNMLGVHNAKKHNIGTYKYTIDKKFDCNQCDMKFTTKMKLNRHLRAHTGVKPFKCRLCNIKFICTSYIKSHLRVKHGIEVNAAEYDVTKYYDVEKELISEELRKL